MPLLLRLLLCLTLLANTAGGAWAAHGLGGTPAVAPPQASTQQGCHEHAAPEVAHPAPSDAAGHGIHDGCCAQAGCDCLQHCGSALQVPAALALTPTPTQAPEPGMSAGQGLARPYQPIRPPIA